MRFSAGDKLGPYEILAPIGQGGMGEVWKARDTRLNRTVAIKRLTSQHTARFSKEARAIASLNHPNICQLYDIGPDYLVMEYIEGRPLEGKFAPEEAQRLAIEIADALEEAHRHGILHRDLKPGNIMLTTKRAVKVVDFGLAKLVAEDRPDATRTIDGAILGTPAYMSPEQAEGKPADERSEIFAFGALLYEMMSGQRAFGRGSLLETLNAVVREEPAALEGPMAHVVRRCLAKEPEQRFQSMGEVRAALEGAGTMAGRQRKPSIAVLPFANLSADQDQAYFSDGLAEEIINSLAKLPGLDVTARTSAFSFRGKDVEIRDIARKLNVEHILEGSIRKAGNRIRVTAQLIKAETGFHIWSERYDRELTDIFEVQDDISSAISANLRLRLTGEQQNRLVKRHTNNVEAYEAYLKGRFHLYRYTEEGLERGLQFLNRAIAVEPEYALAYAGIAEAYAMYSGFQLASAEALPKAQVAAARALQIDEQLAEAHSALAITKTNLEWDWEGAEREYRRAIELYPGHAAAHDWFGFHLALMGRSDDAVRELERAIELDPLSPAFRSDLGEAHRLGRRYETAIEKCKTAIEIDPKFWLAYLILGATYANKGDYPAALAALEKGRAIEYDILFRVVEGQTLARAGEIVRARQVARDLEESRGKGTGAPATFLAPIYAFLGDKDRAFEWLLQGFHDREAFIPFLKVDPGFDPLRSDARFAGLLQRLNFPA